VIRSSEEISRLNKERLAAGLPRVVLTDEERRHYFGDPNWTREAAHQSWEAETVRRYLEGLPLSIDARRQARRIIKEKQ
jgi:hypothetical protein